jgi:hypothetical protein
MTTMTSQRFARIVDAYGADPRRWPDAERAAACDFAQAHPDEAQARLAAAAWLDAGLAADTLEPVDRSLRRRIIASGQGAGRRRTQGARPRLWWLSGAALAGAGVAGLVAGAMATSFFIARGEGVAPVHEPSFWSTGFGVSGGGEEGVE